MRKIGLPLFSSLGTMALLYWIGNLFHLTLFRFSFAFPESVENGTGFEADIAILPFVIGLIVGLIVERSVKVRSE